MINIYIYGAGNYAKRCFEDIIKLGFVVKAFVVTSLKDNPCELFNIPVKGIADLQLVNGDVLIVALKKEFRCDVEKILTQKGINTFLYYPNDSRFDFSMLTKLNSFILNAHCYKFLYIFGAGVYGLLCLDFFKNRNIKVNGVLVSEQKNNPAMIGDIPVLPYKELNSPQEDTLVLVALKPQFMKEVLPLLKERGYINYICLNDDILVEKEKYKYYNINENMGIAWNNRHDFVLEPEAFGCISEIHDKQKKFKFQNDIKFSILVPLYNTPVDFLKEMIASVLFQSYCNWELCLADGSDTEHSYVQTVCQDIANKDKRIKYKKLVENKGVSENTNACIELATGEYIALLDHDDLLHPSALYEMMKVISNEHADFIYTDEATFKSPNLHEILSTNFKPDFDSDYLNGLNYICHFTTFTRKLLDTVGYFNSEYDGAQDYDLFLRLIEKACCIRHIPKCLYFWRASAQSTAMSPEAKNYTSVAGQKAVQKHLERCNTKAVVSCSHPNTYRIKYEIIGEPLISIIIPNYDHWEILKNCVESILNISTYNNYEIIIVENNSKSVDTFNYYKELENNPKIRIIKWEGKFNYSAINNFGVKYAKGEYFLLLNNDIEVISSNWLEEMLMYAQRNDVGAVGAKLYYPNDKIQHAGVIIGAGGIAGHSHKNYMRNAEGYVRRLLVSQNLSAVTAACIMIPKNVFELIKGFNEIFEVAFNDVDLCLRIRNAGYNIIWTPYAELYHYESESRGYEDTIEKQKRFESEVYYFHECWDDFLTKGDPFYNKNLKLNSEDFSILGMNSIFHN